MRREWEERGKRRGRGKEEMWGEVEKRFETMGEEKGKRGGRDE